VDLGDRVVGSAPRAEAIRTRLEVHLEDRLEHQLEGRLHGAVPAGRDAQSPAFAGAGLGDHPLPHRQRGELPRLEVLSQPRQKLLLGGEDLIGSDPIHPRRPLPRLPRTRVHATTSTAGSATRLYRSSNRRPGSSVAHWCSLVWIRSTRASASSTSGHSTPVFTGDLPPSQSLCCELAAALRHVTGFPGLGLLRRLRHAPACPAEHEPAHRRPGRPGGGTSPGRFPRSPHTGRRGRCPALPLRPRHEYAAALPRGLPAGDFTRPRSRPAIPNRQPGVHRPPAHIRQVGAVVPLERLYTLVPHVHLPVSLGRPRPSGSTDPSRRCRGCSHPPRRLPARAAPSFTSLLRQTGDGVLPPPSGNAAPRGARSPRSRR
jgi:hypothetical protein